MTWRRRWWRPSDGSERGRDGGWFYCEWTSYSVGSRLDGRLPDRHTVCRLRMLLLQLLHGVVLWHGRLLREKRIQPRN